MVLFFCTGCGKTEKELTEENRNKPLDYKSYQSDSLEAEYNSQLFYRNDFPIQAADPDIIRITDTQSPDYGFYYMYVTTESIGTVGFYSYKSKDLVNWECNGLAYKPRSDSWGTSRLWGPDVTYYNGTYYMYYCADDKFSENIHLPDGWADRNIGVATSQNPQGPFVQWTGENLDGDVLSYDTPLLNADKFPVKSGTNLHGAHFMDSNLFVDDDGQMYLYFIKDAEPNISNPSIWGISLKDPFTPDYDSAVQITRDGWSKVNGGVQMNDEGMINEAPNMVKHGENYYMTFSVNYIGNKAYSVKQAIGNSPLDPDFEKVANEKGGTLLTAMEYKADGSYDYEKQYDFMSGTGSNCYIEIGDELFVAYQSHIAREPNGLRGIAVDRVHFVRNQDGQEIIYVNGPSYSLQPLAAEASGYKNIVSQAEITAGNAAAGSDKTSLSDGLYKNHNYSFIKEFVTNGSTEIRIEFSDYRQVAALMVYNSFDFEKWFTVIDEILIESFFEVNGKRYEKTYTVSDVCFDVGSFYNAKAGIARPGGSAILEFAEMPVKSITLRIESSKPVGISDIVVLGK